MYETHKRSIEGRKIISDNNLKKISDTGILNDIWNDTTKRLIATLIDTQEKVNANLPGSYYEQADDIERFKRISSLIIKSIYSSIKMNQWVSVKPLYDFDDWIIYTEDNYTSYSIKATDYLKTRMLKTSIDHNVLAGSEYYNSFSENETISDTAVKIANEIDSEVLTDLSNNATWNVKISHNRLLTIVDTILSISEKINAGYGNYLWAVTSPQIASMIRRYDLDFVDEIGNYFPSGTTQIGKIKGFIRLFSTKSVNPNTIIIGKRPTDDNSYVSGYYYCPYISLIPHVNQIYDSFSMIAKRPLLSRHARLLRDANHYGVIRLE